MNFFRSYVLELHQQEQRQSQPEGGPGPAILWGGEGRGRASDEEMHRPYILSHFAMSVAMSVSVFPGSVVWVWPRMCVCVCVCVWRAERARCLCPSFPASPLSCSHIVRLARKPSKKGKGRKRARILRGAGQGKKRREREKKKGVGGEGGNEPGIICPHDTKQASARVLCPLSPVMTSQHPSTSPQKGTGSTAPLVCLSLSLVRPQREGLQRPVIGLHSLWMPHLLYENYSVHSTLSWSIAGCLTGGSGKSLGLPVPLSLV